MNTLKLYFACARKVTPNFLHHHHVGINAIEQAVQNDTADRCFCTP